MMRRCCLDPTHTHTHIHTHVCVVWHCCPDPMYVHTHTHTRTHTHIHAHTKSTCLKRCALATCKQRGGPWQHKNALNTSSDAPIPSTECVCMCVCVCVTPTCLCGASVCRVVCRVCVCVCVCVCHTYLSLWCELRCVAPGWQWRTPHTYTCVRWLHGGKWRRGYALLTHLHGLCDTHTHTHSLSQTLPCYLSMTACDCASCMRAP